MASSLAAQLSQIAATSTHQLNLKAQRAAHSQSLIFDRKVAGSQDFDTIFEICHEGFEELCTLDPRFTAFRKSIFSPQSKTEDRLQMTASQNEELDTVLESFLGLVGSRLLLNPAVKAVDWLIRRFRYV
jgi:U3 small nucleolar RNA-associated protein 10